MTGVEFGTDVLISVVIRSTALIKVPLYSILCVVMKVVKVIKVIRVLILGIYRKTVMHMCFRLA